VNDNGKRVDIYWRKDGSVAITEAGSKVQTITAYGPVSTKGPTSPVDPVKKWAHNPNYLEIDLSKPGTNVIYPDKSSYEKGGAPWG